MKLKTSLLVLVLCLFPGVLMAFDTGLETGGDRNIRIVVESLYENAHQFGLSEELIQAKVELQLRKHGLKGTNESRGNGFLYINVITVENAFCVFVSYARHVTYTVGLETFNTYGRVWTQNGAGIHSGDGSFLIERILELVDIFSAEYLKANNL